MLRDRSNRGVGSHCTNWLLAGSGHRSNELLEVFFGVTKHSLTTVDRSTGIANVLALWQIAQVDHVLFEPGAPRLSSGYFALDLLIFDDLTGSGVDQEHLARLESALANDLLGRNVCNTNFRGEDDESIFGHHEATRAQPIAVQCCTNQSSIGEDNRGWSIPRFHDHGVVLEEVSELRLKVELLFPSARNHHHHGVRKGTAR